MSQRGVSLLLSLVPLAAAFCPQPGGLKAAAQSRLASPPLCDSFHPGAPSTIPFTKRFSDIGPLSPVHRPVGPGIRHPTALRAVSTEEELLEGWKPAVDENTGVTYYWNVETRETTWYKPVKDASSEKDGIEVVMPTFKRARLSRADKMIIVDEDDVERIRRREAAARFAQTLQENAEKVERERELRNLARSPTRQLQAESEGIPAAPAALVVDTFTSFARLASNDAQPSLNQEELILYTEWLATATETTSGGLTFSLPFGLGDQEVAKNRGDVDNFDDRLKKATDPTAAAQKAAQKAIKRSLEGGLDALTENSEKAMAEMVKQARERTQGLSQELSQLQDAAVPETKSFFSRIGGWFSRGDKKKEPETAVSAAPATEVAPEVEKAQTKAPEAPAKPEVVPVEEPEVEVEQEEEALKMFEYTMAGQSGGKPKENQDSTFVGTIDADGTQLAGVFDGHGENGAVVSQFVTETMAGDLASYLQESKDKFSSNAFQNKMKQLFEDTDEQLQASLGEYYGFEFDGSTGSIAVRRGKDLVVANVGDTRCIIGTVDGKVKRLTKDHTPYLVTERRRIQKSGGVVASFPDEPPPEVSGKGRVFVDGQLFPGLAVARAFGDTVAKSVGVTVTPDVIYRGLGKKDQVLIIASDGVWDVVTDEQAVEIAQIHAARKDAVLTAADLVETARYNWEQFQEEFVADGGDKRDFSIDDISAVALFF